MPWLLNQRALYAAPNCIRHLASHRHGSTVYQTRFHTALYGHRPVCQADFEVMSQRGTGCSLISGLIMQAEACGP